MVNYIDQEIEEQLTELLENLYDKWRSCVCGVGTEYDNRDAFLHAVNRRLEKGFSIITEPGMYDDEKEMEMVLGRLYDTWKSYMMDHIGGGIENGIATRIFIGSIKNVLVDIMKKDDVSWKNKIDEGDIGRKIGRLDTKKDVFMELEKIGTRSVSGTYILESNLAYLEQEEEGKVKVVTADGMSEIVAIDKLDKFVKECCMDDDIREELEGLVSIVQKK